MKEKKKIPTLSKFTKDDYEKLILSIINIGTFASILYRYTLFGTIEGDIVYLAGLVLTAFVARKGLSYWKPDRYKEAPREMKKQKTSVNITEEFIGETREIDEVSDGSI